MQKDRITSFIFRWLVFVIALCFTFQINAQLTEAQVNKVDSLKNIIQKAKHDTIVIEAWRSWDNIIYIVDPDLDLALNIKIDSLCALNLEAGKLSTRLRSYYLDSRAFALNNIGIIYNIQGNYQKALSLYKESLSIREELGDQQGITDAYNNIGGIYMGQSDYPQALAIFEKSLALKMELDDPKGISDSYNSIGIVYMDQGEYEKALTYYFKCIEIKEQIEDKIGLAACLNNIGLVYMDQGDYAKGINYHTKALSFNEAIGNKHGLATSFNNLGLIYLDQGDYNNAVGHFNKSLSIREKIGDQQGIATCYGYLGLIAHDEGKFEKAINFHIKSLEIRIKIGDKQGIANSYNNIGIAYQRQGKNNLAMDYYNKSYELRAEIGDRKGLAEIYNNQGQIFIKKGNLIKAEELGLKSLGISKEIGAVHIIRDASNTLYNTYKQMGNYHKSLNMFELYIDMRDSIVSDENHKEMVQQELQYQYEKQLAKDSVKSAEAEKVYLANIAAEEAKTEKKELEVTSQKRQKWFLYGGLLILGIFGIFMFQRFQITKRQKELIDQQKQIVENQHHELETTHKNLAETHREIEDSIKYAERLQLAILPSREDLEGNLGNSFVFFQPKDVVSGDFFWTQKVGQNIFYAAADCTGHGVPGAMVSVVCSNALNRSVKEFGLTNPKDILGKTRDLVIETFANSGKDVKDGMDIALVRRNRTDLVFSGANNPLWIVRKSKFLTNQQRESRGTIVKEELSLLEYKGNKQPVGLYENMEEFGQKKIELFEDDTLYVFTDGLADQFGGEKGKKLKSKAFKHFLISINSLSMQDQHNALIEMFKKWKGNYEQVDDVCVIGIKPSII